MSRRATLAKYALLQIPELVLLGGVLTLAVWSLDLSLPIALGCVALWIVKDIVMFPIVRVAYEPHDHEPGADLLGATGTAVSLIDREGWVQVGPERWRARSRVPIADGALVRIAAIDGLILDVEPEA